MSALDSIINFFWRLFLSQFSFSMLIVVMISSQCLAGGLGGKGGSSDDNHKHYIVHVPLHFKRHHHTHTVYKHVKHEEPVYKVIGYSYGSDAHGGGDDEHIDAGSSGPGGNDGGYGHGLSAAEFVQSHSLHGIQGGGYSSYDSEFGGDGGYESNHYHDDHQGWEHD